MGDSFLSFSSCLGHPQLCVPEGLLKRYNNGIARPLQRRAYPCVVHCSSTSNTSYSGKNNYDASRKKNTIPFEVSKAVFIMKKQGIQVTPKIVHRVKKKEAWKAQRRERKERAKADKVTHPVWYSWPDEEVMSTASDHEVDETEGDGADEFLHLLKKTVPASRIAIQGVNDTSLAAPKAPKISKVRKVKILKLKDRRAAAVGGDGECMVNASVQTLPWKSSTTSVANERDGARQLLQHSSQGFYPPWIHKADIEDSEGSVYIEDSEGSYDSEEHVSLKESDIAEKQETFQASKPLEKMHREHTSPQTTRRSVHINTTVIEKFLDDEIQEVPKGPEVWLKGVGIVESKKRPFSKEIKEMIIAQRKGDWSVLEEGYESEDLDPGLNSPTTSYFDGQRALVEDRRIQRLAKRLHDINYWTSKVEFSRIMHSGRMKLTEDRVLRIVQILGEQGNWRRAMQVVQWVHKRQHYQFHKSKYVLTTLLSVLGKAQRPVEALNVFNVMREDFSSYPDMAAYHAIAVTLGQAGKLKDLLQLIESLEVGPPKPIKFVPLMHWDPSLTPDIVVYNTVLNACIATKEPAGVSWTWEQIDKKGIRPNGATFGLTIEAMVKVGEFDKAIRYFKRMERAGFFPNAETYKCLVEAFGIARKTDEAVQLVNQMESSGIVGSASVYYALACSLCIAGRLKEALAQVRKMQDLPSRKPDLITYTGLIRTCHKAGRSQDAIFLFKHMQQTCAPNVRVCNEMIKVYGWSGMFEEARVVYEGVRKGWLDSCFVTDPSGKLRCDSIMFELMLKAAAVSEKWAYFDRVYRDMTMQGYHLSGRTSLWVMVKLAELRKIDLVDDMMQRLRGSIEVPDLRLYNTQIRSCVEEGYVHRACMYLHNMRADGYQILPTLQSLQVQVGKETWDNFLQQASQYMNMEELYGAVGAASIA